MAQSSGIKKVGVSKLKSTLLRPALTSHYLCEFTTPNAVKSYLDEQQGNGLLKPDSELISLSCSNASLPGSQLTTIKVNNDFHGSTETHGYRKFYDDTADFEFYVDNEYRMINFFENWISYITNDGSANDRRSPSYTYRVNYPKSYRSEISITKFERDMDGRFLKYDFIDAFPTSINSMPVSYDASQLLKCTVSFSFTRYVMSSGTYSDK